MFRPRDYTYILNPVQKVLKLYQNEGFLAFSSFTQSKKTKVPFLLLL